MKNKDIGQFFTIQNSKLGRCLYPFLDCTNKPINAHSIQNSKTFEILQCDNHVIQLKTRFGKDLQPRLDFEPIGRNDASTFLGLCSIHDTSLFEPIDKKPLDIEDEEQLFLLAYRAVLKEFYSVWTGFMKIQKSYHKKVESGLTPGENFAKDMIPIEWGVKAYDTHIYKMKFDEAFRDKNFSAIKHRIIKFDNQSPSIACSQMFSADSVEFENDVLRIVLNVLPINKDTTVAIFSSTDKEYNLANSYLHRCFEGDDFYKKYEVSKQILRNCENFFIRPSFYEKWTADKRRLIVDYFIDTFKYDRDDDSKEFYLFENGA